METQSKNVWNHGHYYYIKTLADLAKKSEQKFHNQMMHFSLSWLLVTTDGVFGYYAARRMTRVTSS